MPHDQTANQANSGSFDQSPTGPEPMSEDIAHFKEHPYASYNLHPRLQTALYSRHTYELMPDDKDRLSHLLLSQYSKGREVIIGRIVKDKAAQRIANNLLTEELRAAGSLVDQSEESKNARFYSDPGLSTGAILNYFYTQVDRHKAAPLIHRYGTKLFNRFPCSIVWLDRRDGYTMLGEETLGKPVWAVINRADCLNEQSLLGEPHQRSILHKLKAELYRDPASVQPHEVDPIVRLLTAFGKAFEEIPKIYQEPMLSRLDEATRLTSELMQLSRRTYFNIAYFAARPEYQRELIIRFDRKRDWLASRRVSEDYVPATDLFDQIEEVIFMLDAVLGASVNHTLSFAQVVYYFLNKPNATGTFNQENQSTSENL